MRRILIAAVTSLAATNAGGAADLPVLVPETAVVDAAAWDAFVAAGAGHAWFDDDSNFGTADADDVAVEVRASAAYALSGGIGLQGDVVFGAFDLADEDDDRTLDIAGHLFHRAHDSFLIGVFGQYGDTETISGISHNRVFAGAEAQAILDKITLYAQGGYQALDGGDGFSEADIEGFFGVGEVRFFATPNWKLEVRGGYSSVEVSDNPFLIGTNNFTLNTFTVGGGTEYRVDETMLSVFLDADYRRAETEDIDAGFLDAEQGDLRVLAGLKLNFGTQTLLERDHGGASLDPVRPGSFFGPVLIDP